jgi:hypothetical protein
MRLAIVPDWQREFQMLSEEANSSKGEDAKPRVRHERIAGLPN